MTVEEAIRAVLLALPDVAALVSTRIYLDKLPQSPTYPCIRVTLVSELSEYQLRGGSGLATARLQVDAYAKENSGVDPYALVARVAAAVHGGNDGSGLSGWRGTIGSPVLEIFTSVRIDRRQSYDPQEDRIVTMSQDYRVTFRT